MMNYLTNIVYDTSENQNFRTVLHTGEHSQLVIMSIPPGGEIGTETHDSVEQTLFFLSGTGTAVLDGERQSIKPGDVLVVAPGTEHNIENTGSTALKIYTIYTPPNHLDGRVHATKLDADHDEEDEAYSKAIGVFAMSASAVTPGFLPDIEPRPNPGSPLQNPDSPAPFIHDDPAIVRTKRTVAATQPMEL